MKKLTLALLSILIAPSMAFSYCSNTLTVTLTDIQLAEGIEDRVERAADQTIVTVLSSVPSINIELEQWWNAMGSTCFYQDEANFHSASSASRYNLDINSQVNAEVDGVLKRALFHIEIDNGRAVFVNNPDRVVFGEATATITE